MLIEMQGSAAKNEQPRFTVGTLVNDDAHYSQMLQSFRRCGFTEATTEFLAVREAPSAFVGLNGVLSRARGDFVILCHQDIRLLGDGAEVLDQRLDELGSRDPYWGVAGNAGGEAPGRLAIRISDPHGRDRRVGELPAKVMSLDENFIIVRREAGLRFSRDLEGFHLYGADLCLVADVMGWSSWVVDFHVEHLSPGRKDETFRAAEQKFRNKWRRALRPRWMQTPCTLLRLTGGKPSRIAGRVSEGLFRRVVRRLPGAAGWSQAMAKRSDAH
jgi:hypothetical protein